MTVDSVRYSTGYRWQLREAVQFETGIKGLSLLSDYVVLSPKGMLWLREGYATDGVSGITGKPWAKLLERPWMRRGSFGHDGLYQLLRLGLLPAEYRQVADELLRQWCLEDGGWEWQADIVFAFVDKLAGPAAKVGTDRPVLEAP